MWQDIINSLKSLGLASGGVTLNSLLAGEDLTADVIKTETRGVPFNIAVNATISIIDSAGGFLHTVLIGQTSNPTITIYDNASGASGTILFHADAGQRDSYLVDMTYVNGATAYLTAGNSTRITGSYR